MSVKTFDLDQKYPQAVLVGNGLIRDTGIGWTELIENCKRPDVELTPYKKGNEFLIPNNILTLAGLPMEDAERHRKYAEQLSRIQYRKNDLIDKIVSLPVDAILTTNYTYELEYSLNNRYPTMKEAVKRKYVKCASSDPVREKYLIRTYSKMNASSPDIWHIHGEIRRPSSLVLSHEEYARLVNKILEYNTKRGNNYEAHRSETNMKSWVDYMILADLYIIGFGFDFSEFDLWWLLNRRFREKTNVGKVFYYEPMSDNNELKHKALSDIGVNVKTMGVNLKNAQNNEVGKLYKMFYEEAIQDIALKTGGESNV